VGGEAAHKTLQNIIKCSFNIYANKTLLVAHLFQIEKERFSLFVPQSGANKLKVKFPDLYIIPFMGYP
jgi:hypothetical protein